MNTYLLWSRTIRIKADTELTDGDAEKLIEILEELDLHSVVSYWLAERTSYMATGQLQVEVTD